MPGPFPGMDPYLENPTDWPGVHDSLVTYIWEAVMAALPDGYEAKVEDRCYVVGIERDIIPDVTVFPVTRPRRDVSTAVLEPDEPLLFRAEPMEMHENYIHIYRKGDRGRIITAIELLSPSNKAANTPGRRVYLEKQREITSTRTHLLEIDLLRAGEHTVSVPAEALRAQERWDYLACLHRTLYDTLDARREMAAWPRTLRERLPRAAVPLDRGDDDIVLDIQAVLDRYYEAGRYASRIAYESEAYPPLREEDRIWADALLREKGLRT